MVLFAELTGQDWVIILTAIGLIIERVIAQVLSANRNAETIERDKVINEKVNVVTEKVEETAKVGKDVTKKLDVVEETGKKVHLLVNSQLGTALVSNAVLARYKAEQTKDKRDELLATNAERVSDEHAANQKQVDRGENTPVAPKS